MVNQFYDAEIIKEYVIRGNSAVLKCSIPSFVADFVYVESWIDEEGTVYKTSNDYGWCCISYNYVVWHSARGQKIVFLLGFSFISFFPIQKPKRM